MSAAGVLVRTAMWLVLATACLLLGSSCAGGTRGAGGESAAGGVLGAGVRSGAWASDAELAWLRKLGAWDARLVAGLQRVAQIESSPRLVRKLLAHDSATVLAHNRALAVAGTCSADLRSTVGMPPSERLRSTLAAFDRACTHLERFHNAMTLAVFRAEDYLLRQARTEAKLGPLRGRRRDGVRPGKRRGRVRRRNRRVGAASGVRHCADARRDADGDGIAVRPCSERGGSEHVPAPRLRSGRRAEHLVL